jgi:hypothetical protein
MKIIEFVINYYILYISYVNSINVYSMCIEYFIHNITNLKQYNLNVILYLQYSLILYLLI